MTEPVGRKASPDPHDRRSSGFRPTGQAKSAVERVPWLLPTTPNFVGLEPMKWVAISTQLATTAQTEVPTSFQQLLSSAESKLLE